MFNNNKAAEVKRRAHGHWRDVLESLGISADRLDGRGHPCPKCGGTDRFTFTNRNDDGGLLCRKCGEHIGDGLAAVQWLTGCDFPAALKTVADCLHIQTNTHVYPNTGIHPNTTSAPQVGEIQTPAVSSVPLALSSVSVSESADDKPTPHEAGHIADESNHEPKHEPKHETERVDHIYRDIDENGQTVERYRVVRINDDDGSKTIRKPTGFNKSKDGILYHLDRIKRDSESPIYWVEGEKDADRLTTARYLATTCGACHDWKPEYAEPLRGRDVIVLYDCDEPGKKLAKEVIRDILPVVSSLRVVNIEPLYIKAMERLRSLASENVEHEADDPLYAEREQILNHPPKGADISDYLDVLRASRSPDSDWGESEDWLEIRNLIYSGHTFTVNIHVKIETQLPFLNWENQQSEARTSSMDAVRNPVTIPFPREEYPELIPDEENETQPENLQNYPFLEEAKKYLPSKVADFQNDPYPYERFPERFVDWIAHQAERLETVPQALGTMLLPSIGAHIGNTTLWVDDNRSEPPIVWGVNVAEPGTGKTPIAKAVISLYSEAERNAAREYQKSLNEYNEAVANREKPSKSSIINRIICIDDATTEAVARQLQFCSPLLLNRDEGDGWVKSFGAYSNGKGEKDSPFWNECYNGGTKSVSRATEGFFYIPQCAVCVATSFQYSTFLESIWNRKSKGNGMASRFLFCKPPTGNIPHKRMSTPDELRIPAQSAFTQLRKNRFDSNIPPAIYQLSDEAAQVYDQFYNVINGLGLRIGGGGSYKCYLPKMMGQVYRIALIFQCVDDLNASEFTQQNDTPKIITPETMEAACDVASWYIREFARITNWADDYQAGRKIRYNMDRAGGDEGRFLQYLQKKLPKHPNGVPRSIIMQGMGLKKDEVFQLAAQLEMQKMIVITERENPTGKPTVFYKPR